MEAISVFKMMPVTKSQITDFVGKIKEQILSGYENPLDVSIMLASMEETIKQLRKDEDIKSVILEEAEKYNENTFEHSGATFTKRMTGVRYDFSGCGDSLLSDLENEKSLIDSKIKARQDWIKGFKQPTADPETGEIINPPVKKGSESISITLKK